MSYAPGAFFRGEGEMHLEEKCNPFLKILESTSKIGRAKTIERERSYTKMKKNGKVRRKVKYCYPILSSYEAK